MQWLYCPISTPLVAWCKIQSVSLLGFKFNSSDDQNNISDLVGESDLNDFSIFHLQGLSIKFTKFRMASQVQFNILVFWSYFVPISLKPKSRKTQSRSCSYEEGLERADVGHCCISGLVLRILWYPWSICSNTLVRGQLMFLICD